MMISNRRQGSILLLCIAIVTALMMIAFAYVRVASLQHEANDSENRMLLAREAAKMGLDHAVECIIRENVAGPATRMEDSSRALFLSFHRAYESDYGTEDSLPGGTQAVNLNDLPAEDNLLNSMSGGPYGWNSMANQMHIYDGRGRFIEPGFYNLPVTGYVPAATAIATPVRFGTPWALTDPLPDRSDGIFYDSHLRRIAGDPRTARTSARYRLRYAVGVMDLDGTMLATGDPAVDYSSLNFPSPLSANPDPAHDLTPAERVVRWSHAVPQIVFAGSKFGQTSYSWGAGVGGGPRIEHVFKGRGTVSNFDRHSAASKAPITFPYMYRNSTIYDFANTPNSGPAPSFYLGGSPAGGTAIPNSVGLIHGLTGPQLSFTNFDEAVEGRGGDHGNAHSYGRFSPFGRGLVKTNPVRYSRWSGNVDTPWCVNLMTAPAAVIYGMIAGYMPPGAICTWRHEEPPNPPANFPNGLWIGRSFDSALLGCRDLFVKEMSPAFGPGYGNYTTPYRIGNPAIAPDYHEPAFQEPNDMRAPNERYPGIMALNGSHSGGGGPRLHDNLGIYLRASGKPTALSNFGGEVDRTGRPEVVRLTNNGLRYKERSIYPNPHQPRNEIFWWMNGSLTGGPSTRTGATPAAAPLSVPEWSNAITYPVNAIVKMTPPPPPVTVPPTPPTPPRYFIALIANVASPPDVWINQQWNPASPPPPAAQLYFPRRWNEISEPTPGWDSTVVGAHPDSIWDVLGNAMSTTIAIARGQYMQFGYPMPSNEFQVGRPAKYFNRNPWVGPRVTNIKEIDAIFVAQLGSSITQPNDPTPVAAYTGWAGYDPEWTNRLALIPGANPTDPVTPTWNLAKLRTATTTVQVMPHAGSLIPRILVAGATPQVDLCLPQPPTGLYTFPIAAWNHPAEPRYDGTMPTYSADERTAITELIINDFRLSFFGASPGYGDDFRALDLNGDGKAHCSGFRSVGSPAEIALHIDQYTTSLDAGGVATVPVDAYFSNTGCFFFGRSRFWRVLVRGEVWDNVLNTSVNSAQLETVLAVDPVNAAQEWVPGGTPDPAAGQYSTHVIHQRWIYNTYRGLLPRQQ